MGNISFIEFISEKNIELNECETKIANILSDISYLKLKRVVINVSDCYHDNLIKLFSS